jgi:hypothetical protein
MRSTTFSTTFSGERRARGRPAFDERLDARPLVLVGDELRLQRLRELRAVAIERVGLERELPGQQVSRLAVLDRGVVRHVDGLGDGARDERLRRRHHADVALDREIALAVAPARIGAVEHRVVLGRRCGAPSTVMAPQTWMLAASISRLVKPRRGEGRTAVGELLALDAELVAETLRQGPLVEHELDVEGGRQRLLDWSIDLVGEALLLERSSG